jgi:hypothetical protein
MPVTYEIMSDLVIFTAREWVTDEDFRKAFKKVIADPRFRRGSKVLTYDLESAYEPTMTDPKEAAMTIKSFMSHFSPRVAVVVGHEASVGLGQLIQRYCEEFGVAFRVFRDPEQAKDWLYPKTR